MNLQAETIHMTIRYPHPRKAKVHNKLEYALSQSEHMN
jgi:hypothetical protein